MHGPSKAMLQPMQERGWEADMDINRRENFQCQVRLPCSQHLFLHEACRVEFANRALRSDTDSNAMRRGGELCQNSFFPTLAELLGLTLQPMKVKLDPSNGVYPALLKPQETLIPQPNTIVNSARKLKLLALAPRLPLPLP